MCPWSQLPLWGKWRQSPTTEPRLIWWVIKAHWMQCESFFPAFVRRKLRGNCLVLLCTYTYVSLVTLCHQGEHTLQLHVFISAQVVACFTEILLLMQEGCLNFSWTWIALKQRLMLGHCWAKWATCVQVHDWTRTRLSKCHPSTQLDKQWLSNKYPLVKSQVSVCSLKNCEKTGEEIFLSLWTWTKCVRQLPVDADYVLMCKCASESFLEVSSG